MVFIGPGVGRGVGGKKGAPGGGGKKKNLGLAPGFGGKKWGGGKNLGWPAPG